MSVLGSRTIYIGYGPQNDYTPLWFARKYGSVKKMVGIARAREGSNIDEDLVEKLQAGVFKFELFTGVVVIKDLFGFTIPKCVVRN